MDKSIDLGKLQTDLLKAQAQEKRTKLNSTLADRALQRAQAHVDQADKLQIAALNNLDKIKKAVTDAARAVINSQ